MRSRPVGVPDSGPMKPCARAGCQAQIDRATLTPSLYAKRRFCSTRCAALERYAYGAKPPRISHAQAVASGRKGGLKAGERKRRATALRVAANLERYVTPELEVALSAVGLARLKAL